VPLEIRRLETAWTEALGDFFEAIAGEEHFFHPHPLTRAEAARVGSYGGRDLYYVAVDNGVVLAYGLLRGWDDGYDVPSLGLALRPDVRGTGLARCMMEFLHAAARQRGSTSVRLTVEPDNVAARRLYDRLGYAFSSPEHGKLVGTLALEREELV
jgi:ribosomal protein S18 acetylase RimI-like enzyme